MKTSATASLIFIFLLFAFSKSYADSSDCLKFYRSDDVQMAPSAARRDLNSKAENCFKKSMNKALDQRLLFLKKEKSKNFLAEMDLQKSFNAAVNDYCGRWEDYYRDCQASSSFNEFTECKIDFYTFRESQATQIDAKQLELSVSKAHEKPIELFSEFAKKLCALTELGWKDQKIPIDCVDRTLATLQSSVKDDGKKLVCNQDD